MSLALPVGQHSEHAHRVLVWVGAAIALLAVVVAASVTAYRLMSQVSAPVPAMVATAPQGTTMGDLRARFIGRGAGEAQVMALTASFPVVLAPFVVAPPAGVSLVDLRAAFTGRGALDGPESGPSSVAGPAPWRHYLADQ